MNPPLISKHDKILFPLNRFYGKAVLKQERFLEFSIDEENWLLVHCLCRVPSMNTVNGPSHRQTSGASASHRSKRLFHLGTDGTVKWKCTPNARTGKITGGDGQISLPPHGGKLYDNFLEATNRSTTSLYRHTYI